MHSKLVVTHKQNIIDLIHPEMYSAVLLILMFGSINHVFSFHPDGRFCRGFEEVLRVIINSELMDTNKIYSYKYMTFA